jgi:protein-tyrosine-phosphatase
LRRAATAHVRDVVRPGDLVVAVCDHAYEELAGDSAPQLHWSIPDPARSGSTAAFDRAFNILSDRVGRLAGALEAATNHGEDRQWPIRT